MRQILFLIATSLILVTCQQKSTQRLSVSSPDGLNQIELFLEGDTFGTSHVYYRVHSRGNEVLKKSLLELRFGEMAPLGPGLRIIGKTETRIDESYEKVWGRTKQARDFCNELIVELQELDGHNRKINWIFRAYDDGVTFRYELPKQQNINDFKLIGEDITFSFTADHTVWAADYKTFNSHQEEHFVKTNLSGLGKDALIGQPLLVRLNENLWASLTEANLTDWAGMYFKQAGNLTLRSQLSPRLDDPEVLVASKIPRKSPWRLIMLGNSPGNFLETNILSHLNAPNQLDDVSWIQPGKSAWDWWWCNRYSPEVDFTLGPNNETMKHFIDFAADMGWEYQLVDWQWYGEPFKPTHGDGTASNLDADITTSISGIDIPELVRYAAEKGVKLLVWLEWGTAEKQMEEAFPLYEKWGVAGVKVDFMQRDDQEMVNFYHDLVKLAAKHHLTVDFHGAYKPTGISRTYPNLLTREGVLGNEYTKWSDRVTPEHKVTIPFTRGALGEMDFTPGSFVNVKMTDFKTESESPTPRSMGSRCNQLAMMVVYESPLQVLCDAPYNYRKDPGGLEFLKVVPTTWEETKVIHASVGEYITVARRVGDTWYIGSMNHENPRTLDLPLTFLGEGNYIATIWQDSEQTDQDPQYVSREELTVSSSDTIPFYLAEGGGFVTIISPE